MDAIPWQPPLALVADDLTGAGDAGVHFLAAGWRVEVALDPGRSWPAADLAVICTRTRGVTPAEARRVVDQVAKRLREAGRRVLYKKMDSTLHGNYGAEIGALLAAGVASYALICPAFPDMGRRLMKGELRLGPERHATGRNLLDRLHAQGSGEVWWQPASFLRQPLEAVAAEVRSAAARGRPFAVFDAEDEGDLARVVALAMALQGEGLLCGSTGLARHLGRALASLGRARSGPGGCPQASEAVGTRKGTGTGSRPLRRVAFIGSRSPVTARQMEVLVSERGARVVEPDGPGLRFALAAGQPPVIVTLDLGTVAEKVLGAALEMVREAGPAALLFSGGDTAQRICDLARVEALRLGGEIEMGLPQGRLDGGWFDGWLVATKAGGFGDESSLVRWADICEFMNGPLPR